MGLLTKTLRVAHPVRTVERSVKRAVIPRPARKALSVKNTVVHPVSHVKYKAIGGVDRAVTPKHKPRARRSSHAKPTPHTHHGWTLFWGVVLFLLCFAGPTFGGVAGWVVSALTMAFVGLLVIGWYSKAPHKLSRKLALYAAIVVASFMGPSYGGVAWLVSALGMTAALLVLTGWIVPRVGARRPPASKPQAEVFPSAQSHLSSDDGEMAGEVETTLTNSHPTHDQHQWHFRGQI